MVFVDTSVWVAAYRKPTSVHADTLRSLLDADEVGLALPVRIEFLSGAGKRDRRRLRHLFSSLPLAVPGEETWQLVDRWIGAAHDAGFCFSFPDLVIAALTSERHARVWSLDTSFQAMEKLGFVQLYE